MTYHQIMTALKKKDYSPIYFLMGEEPYYIDKITNYIVEHVLTQKEKDFNQTIVYGKDIDTPSIINIARRFPMMSKRQVVVVKEAQDLKKIEDLIFYVNAPLKSTVLVINYKYKSLDKRLKLYKALDTGAILFESKKLYDNKVPDWIREYLDERNFTINPVAALMLTEFLGNDLNKISNELDKLIITMPANQKEITADIIEKNIGISKDFNSFELNKALATKDVLKANRIVNYFGANQKTNPISATISTLYYFFSKLLAFHYAPNKTDNKAIAAALKINPFFLAEYREAAKKYTPKKSVEIIALLREYDVKSKGVNSYSATPADLLKELIYKIMH